MIAIRLWWMLLRRQQEQRLTMLLALIAFGTATGALLTVLGGLGAFTERGGAGGMYTLLAQIATVILVIPVITLGGSAARLSVSRRDDRLAAMRLAGATSGQVGLIAVADAAVQALTGALIGVVLYLVALPGVALINFQGRAFAWSELWVGPGVLALTVLGVVLLATVSAAVSLVRIVISPLGVAQRTSARSVSAIRVVAAVVVLALWAPLMNTIGSAQLMVALVFFGICFGVLNLIGPFVLGLIGRISVARARTVPGLLAARRLLDDPRAAWRPVAGVTLATFVAGVLSISPALSASAPGSSDPQTAHLPADLMTGSILTLVIAALLAAVSAGVNQAARIYDLRDQYRMLHLIGTDVPVLKQARMRETGLPLVASVGIAAVVSLIMVAPFGIPLIVLSPLGIITFAGGIVVSLAMVLAAVRLSQPLVDRVLAGRAVG